MAKTKDTEKTAAVVTIFDAPDMNAEGKKEIADWLRRQAQFLEEYNDLLSPRYRARYFYTPGKQSAV